jgi:hypothetical protein
MLSLEESLTELALSPGGAAVCRLHPAARSVPSPAAVPLEAREILWAR